MSFTPTDSLIYLVPFPVEKDYKEFDSIAINCTTLEEYGLCKLGVYLATPAGVPGTKIIQTNELNLNATGIVEDAISLVLAPGLYFVAFAGNTTTAILTSRSVSGLLARTDVSAGVATMVTGVFSYTGVDEDLPSDVGTITYNTADPPLIGLRTS